MEELQEHQPLYCRTLKHSRVPLREFNDWLIGRAQFDIISTQFSPPIFGTFGDDVSYVDIVHFQRYEEDLKAQELIIDHEQQKENNNETTESAQISLV
jgi:hypothetical protein